MTSVKAPLFNPSFEDEYEDSTSSKLVINHRRRRLREQQLHETREESFSRREESTNVSDERRSQSYRSRLAHLQQMVETRQSELQNKEEIVPALLRRIKQSEIAKLQKSKQIDIDVSTGDTTSNTSHHTYDVDTSTFTDAQHIRHLEKRLAALTNEVISKSEHINDLIHHICELERDDQNETDEDEDDIPSNESVMGILDNSEDDDGRADDDAVLASQILGMSIRVKSKKSNKHKRKWYDKKKQILLEAIAEVETESSSSDDDSIDRCKEKNKEPDAPFLGLIDYVCRPRSV